jgi:hypothetical protein
MPATGSVTVTAIFESITHNVMHGTLRSGFRTDTTPSLFSITKNQTYEFEIQYKTLGNAGRAIAVTVIPQNADSLTTYSGLGDAVYSGSRGAVETYLGTTMVTLDGTNGTWVTEKFTFQTTGDFITSDAYPPAGVYVCINPESVAGDEGWVNYVSLRRMTGDAGNIQKNVLYNPRFKRGMTNWKKHTDDNDVDIVEVNAPQVPAYAIWDVRD